MNYEIKNLEFHIFCSPQVLEGGLNGGNKRISNTHMKNICVSINPRST